MSLTWRSGETYHGDFINAWDKSVALDVARKTEDFAQIGGSSALELSPKCQDDFDKYDDVIRKADWDAWEMYLNGTLEEDVVTGTYDRDLTITDGKSINATWRGVWGQENSGAEVESPGSSGTLLPSGTDLTSETALPSKTLSTETVSTSTIPTRETTLSSETILYSETTSSSKIATTGPSAQSITTPGGQVVPTTLATSTTISASASTDDYDYDQKETTVRSAAVEITSTSASATETGTAADGPGCRAGKHNGRKHRHHRHRHN